MSAFQRICFLHYHEVGLKGHNRGRFERRLRDNIAHALIRFPGCGLSRISGHLIVDIHADVDPVSLADELARIPGIVKVSSGVRTEKTMAQLCEAASLLVGEHMPVSTFKVAGKRSNTDFEYGTMDINRTVGAAVLEAYPSLKVDCEHPALTVNALVIQAHGYVLTGSTPGIGGLPVGSSGKVVSLLSAGIDSPVATWKMVRRGAVAVCVHFSGRPQTSGSSEYLVHDLVNALSSTAGIQRLYTFPIGDYQRRISLDVDPKLRVIMYRRLMLAVAREVAFREHAGALVTGESLGQVASQTLDNIRATDEVATLPVFRPLIGSDKAEIIDRARKIGTYDISILNQDDCCTLFMPRKPETHADLDEVHAAWELLPVDEWIPELLENAEIADFDCVIPSGEGRASI